MGLVTAQRPSWWSIPVPDWTGALCADEDAPIDPELFHEHDFELAAMRVCEGCPVKQACLDYALEVDASGVWGGTTRAQRRGMRRVVA